MQPRRTMTAEQFTKWVSDMLAKGRATSEADCARQLDATHTTLIRLKKQGADHRTALACSALIRGLAPYG